MQMYPEELINSIKKTVKKDGDITNNNNKNNKSIHYQSKKLVPISYGNCRLRRNAKSSYFHVYIIQSFLL